MKKIRGVLIAFLLVSHVAAQQPFPHIDTSGVKELDSVLVFATTFRSLPELQGVFIYSGKKTHAIAPDASSANLAQNVSRMIFARIPGLNVWEMDGAGLQVNVGSRGTDMHRSIEMNMRQNGYNTNSDMFGYPENHYTPPAQGIREIQLVKGSAALQFGSQFGGMMNYIMKEGDSSRPFVLESEQTAGTGHLFNSYNAAGGTIGKVSYYTYYDQRLGDGWRPDAAFVYHAFYGGINYHFNPRGTLSLQFSRMSYRQQIAGGLTDQQFDKDPRQSTRSRNYFNPEINIPALLFHYELSSSTLLSVTAHYLGGERNSVQFINTPNIADTFNTGLGSYNPRQVDRDYYNGFTMEARVLHHYSLGKMNAAVTGGIRYFTETTRRRQKGTGTVGSDFDLTLVRPYGIDLHLHSGNYAIFAENLFRLTSRLSVTPGFRYEVINSKLSGMINNASFPVSYKGNRNFPLFGTGVQYQATPTSQLYGNISQAYRPYLYANITPADQVGVIDPNLKDSKGYDIDLGYRGRINERMIFDINAFYLYYGNRTGQLTLTDANNAPYLYTTNIGNSLAKGIEGYVEIVLWKLKASTRLPFDLRVFNSLAFDQARYTSGMINNNGHNTGLKGNHVEGVPDWINRTGLIFQAGALKSSLQYSYVSKTFSDANNTLYNPTGATGIVPAYQVWDWSADWRFLTHYHISGGINNLANARYFTRRINMYPGPGILPADGRTFYISFGLKL